MIPPAVRGAWAALRTPLWLRRGRFRELLRPAAGGAGAPAPDAPVRGGPVPDAGVPDVRDIRAAARALRVLSLLPRSPWRSTCLYRSVAACLLLRERGVPARIRLGVRRSEPGAAPRAHAWVTRLAAGDAGDARDAGDAALPELVELLPATGPGTSPRSPSAGPGSRSG